MTDAFHFNILTSKSTCVLLQRVLPLLAAEQHHQLNHGGRRLERVDCLRENDVRRVDRTRQNHAWVGSELRKICLTEKCLSSPSLARERVAL